MDATLLRRLDLESAIIAELSTRNRLLPRRWDDSLLLLDVAGVTRWVRPQLRKDREATTQDIVLVNKGWRGLRPLSAMSLVDRITYRALVELLRAELPDHLRERQPIAKFRRAPLEIDGTRYVLQTDVAAYFQFVDHELLADELLAQTGEEPAVDAVVSLLAGVTGRRFGIPQINSASDVLSDVYIDSVRRRLARAGFAVFRYADDFRVSCPTLGSALKALEACDGAVRDLGLVLNERKTLTYSRENYEQSLDAFKRREAEFFAAENADGDLSDLDEGYEIDSSLDPEETLSQLTGAEPIAVDDEEVLTDDEEGLDEDARVRLGRAANRVWEIWLQEDESHDAQSRQDAAITQSLLGRALPFLGSLGETAPLENLAPLLRHEPALTPQIVAFLTCFAGSGREAARSARDALDDVVTSDFLSPWQAMWLAHAAGMLPRRTGGKWPGKHIEWLQGAVESGTPALAATAAMALGRRRKGDSAILASALDRVGPEWRNLLFLGLALLDADKASSCAEGSLDRILLAGAAAA